MFDAPPLREMRGPRMRIRFACVEKESHSGRGVERFFCSMNHTPPRPTHIYRVGVLGCCRFKHTLGVLQGCCWGVGVFAFILSKVRRGFS
jgi:hypothetical protein